MTKPDFERASAYAHTRLSRELAPTLLFHSLAHTADDVVPAVERFAAEEGVAGHDLLLLRTAGWFHDLGYVRQRAEHEALSAEIAAEVLPAMGYSAVDVEAIRGMIMATRIPQTPHNLLEQLLADADLNVLGQPDFLVKNQALRDELAAENVTYSDTEWYGGQLKFISQHRYFTRAAQQLNDARKARNVEAMAVLLKRSQIEER
ncbi:MAG: HD domain-containing protein [bacterium]|nr:HD domain-containing protein [bacterium]